MIRMNRYIEDCAIKTERNQRLNQTTRFRHFMFLRSVIEYSSGEFSCTSKMLPMKIMTSNVSNYLEIKLLNSPLPTISNYLQFLSTNC